MSVSALSAGEYTTTLLVMVDRVKGGGMHPLPGWDEFTIMLECTPENGHRQYICTLSSVICTFRNHFSAIFCGFSVCIYRTYEICI
jgi:hypothetical protein